VNKLIVASAQYKRAGMVAGFWDGLQHAKLKHMPQALQDADRKINPDPKHLEQLFLQDSQRMFGFKDWPAEDLKSIAAPTLLLLGDQDVITAEHVVEMHRLIPNSRLAILPANHGSYLGEIASREAGSVMPQVTVMILNQFLAT
jgi:pimeloyl-ACP methyl ester carboxylesterase